MRALYSGNANRPACAAAVFPFPGSNEVPCTSSLDCTSPPIQGGVDPAARIAAAISSGFKRVSVRRAKAQRSPGGPPGRSNDAGALFDTQSRKADRRYKPAPSELGAEPMAHRNSRSRTIRGLTPQLVVGRDWPVDLGLHAG